jgi:RimJ/RimL family protein N-acetyltransferase
MNMKILQGNFVRLEPLSHVHTDGLTEASAGNELLFKWTPVPQGKAAVTAYIDTAVKMRDSGTSEPFAIIGSDGLVKGSTRFWNMEYWAWPEGHPRHGNKNPDVCEIGHTWLTHTAIRTGINTEAKLLLLTHAFETWNVLRVCLHTDVRNERSRAAIERIGGKLEGILRAQKMSADFKPRDSARYSIIIEEWPEVKENLISLLKSRNSTT